MSLLQHIAIIGAGPAGLVALKSLREIGLTPVVFEKGPELGGVWRFDESLPDGGGLAYRSLKTNTSKRTLAFSDFAFPATVPDYPTRAEVLQYLQAYATHFNLHPHLRLNTTVQSVARTNTGQWQVQWHTAAGEAGSGLFDAVIVAIGFHGEPFYPAQPSAAAFQGVVAHSGAYKGPEPFVGQRVVVIGTGSSGADVAAEVSTVAQVELSARTGSWFIPHHVQGQPYDLRMSRVMRQLPLAVREHLLRRSLLRSYQAFGFAPTTVAAQLRLPPFDTRRGRLVPATAILRQIQQGAVRLRPAISEITAAGVRYTDGTYSPADAIVFCTGYQLRLPFLAPDLIPIEGRHTVRLYKQVFHPTLDNLACLALHGVTGAVFPVAEMQARWVAQVFAGHLTLPPPAERARWIAAYFAAHARANTNPMRLENGSYLDGLARLLGVMPRLAQHPALLPQLLFGPFVAAQYRLDGPGHSPRALAILQGRWE